MSESAYEAMERLIEDVGEVELSYQAGYYDGQSTKVDHDDIWYAVIGVDFGFGMTYTILELVPKGVDVVGSANGLAHAKRMAKSYSKKDGSVLDN